MTKIILAEDEEFIASLYKLNMEKMGAEVRVAGNGKEVIEILKDFQPDLLLLDGIMPEMNGMETLQYLHDKGHKFPIVMLTNLSQEIDKKKYEELGAVDYIVKSDVAVTDLWQRLQKFLAK